MGMDAVQTPPNISVDITELTSVYREKTTWKTAVNIKHYSCSTIELFYLTGDCPRK